MPVGGEALEGIDTNLDGAETSLAKIEEFARSRKKSFGLIGLNFRLYLKVNNFMVSFMPLILIKYFRRLS